MKTTIAIGILFAVARIWIGLTIPPETLSGEALFVACFKDAAHVFMGGLAVVAWGSVCCRSRRVLFVENVTLDELFLKAIAC